MNFINSIPYTTNEQGASTDRLDYLLKMKNFLVTISGYTEILYDDTLTEHRLVVEKGGLYLHFQTYTKTSAEGISYFCSYGFDIGFDFYTQPTEPDNVFSIPLSGNIPQYYFYYNGRNIIFVTEFQSGVFSYCVMGHFTSLGSGYTNAVSLGNLRVEYSSLIDIQNNYRPITTYPYEHAVVHLDQIENVDISTSILDVPTFIDHNILKASKIKFNEKGALFSPMFLTKYGTQYKPTLEISDFFVCFKEYFNVAEVFSLGARQFISFPSYEKEIPADVNLNRSEGLSFAIRTL